ncbi:hypothetical protein CYMTET_15331 [Cymbomonas tetramitiformis]|uniref:Pesticidal crystal protein Cry22Aa Ig-like domain-containing protein n=1 Tax=Cymbomonas tetramitiformis TaxID=36881 RepID=A0AAE0GEK7_9CHLO|nr:hypothetical protein CYMTET_15331 [Cymbomonas tetramitiformis]
MRQIWILPASPSTAQTQVTAQPLPTSPSGSADTQVMGLRASHPPRQRRHPGDGTAPPSITLHGKQTPRHPGDRTAPPSITLHGSADTQVLQQDIYVDAGVSVQDVVDGTLIPEVVGLDSVDTSEPTVEGHPFIITYSATDSSGNLAAVERRVEVTPLCAIPSFLCHDLSDDLGEAVCATCVALEENPPPSNSSAALANSTEGFSCICLSPVVLGEEVEEELTSTYIPVNDTLAPIMQLRGDGQLAVTTAGQLVMIHTILVGDQFSDPGVDAEDEVDGNITSRVTSFGASAINTSIPTAEDAPYIITYYVQDAAGNDAPELRRRVYVANPCTAPETPCEDGTCSEAGLCLAFLQEEEDGEEGNTAPLITLVGPAALRVYKDAGYGRCPDQAPLDATCDRGASAVDDEDGVLDQEVLACSPDGVSYKFVKKGVEACEVDTTRPGEYEVHFEVYDSLGARASISRHVTVLDECSVGEHLCANDPTVCSAAGICISDMEAPESPEMEDEAPVIWLVNNSVLPAFLDVRQGVAYMACAPSQVPKEGALCEAGAEAWDHENGNLTARVLSCPPQDCQDVGCPGHEFASKGVEGCIDTTGEVGTTLVLTFTVFDDAIPANVASINRTLTIVSPCPEGEELCADGACSTADCATREQLLQASTTLPDTSAPNITLLNPARLRVQYGVAETAPTLAVCGSYTEQDFCGGVAWDEVDGDVTASLSLRLLNSTSGIECGVEDLATALCFPAVYTYIYEAADEARNVATALIVVELVEQADVAVVVQLRAAGATLAGAEAEAETLRDETSAEAAAFREGVAEATNGALEAEDPEEGVEGGLPVMSRDVTITAVRVVEIEEDGSQGYLLLVNCTVAAVVADGVGDTSPDASLRRRLMTGAPTQLPAIGPTEPPTQVQPGSPPPPPCPAGDADPVARRATAVADALSIAATPGQDGTEAALSGHLRVAAEKHDTTWLADATALGLEANGSTWRITAEVDEEAARAAELRAELAGLSSSAAATSAVLTEVEGLIREHAEGAHPDPQESMALDVWTPSFAIEVSNVESLMASTNQALEEPAAASAELLVAMNEAALADAETDAELQETLTANATVADEEAASEWCSQMRTDSIRFTFSVGLEAEVAPVSTNANMSSTDTNASSASPPPPLRSRRLLARASSSKSSSSTTSTTSEDTVTGDEVENDDSMSASYDAYLASLGITPTGRHFIGTAPHNQILTGMLVTQWRSDAAECTDRFAHLQICYTGPPNSAPFGTDPAFNLASSASPTTAATFVGAPSEGYPVLFKSHISGIRASLLLELLEGGQYLGEQTRQVQVQLVTYSATSGIFAYIQMNALREKGGYYRLETEVTGLSESWWLALERPSSAAVLVVWVAAVLVWFRRDLLHFFQFSRDATLVTALHLLLTSKAALTTWQVQAYLLPFAPPSSRFHHHPSSGNLGMLQAPRRCRCAGSKEMLQGDAPPRRCSSKEMLLRGDAPPRRCPSKEMPLQGDAPPRRCSSKEMLKEMPLKEMLLQGIQGDAPQERCSSEMLLKEDAPQGMLLQRCSSRRCSSRRCSSGDAPPGDAPPRNAPPGDALRRCSQGVLLRMLLRRCSSSDAPPRRMPLKESPPQGDAPPRRCSRRCPSEEMLLRGDAPPRRCSTKEMLLQGDAPPRRCSTKEMRLQGDAPPRRCSSKEPGIARTHAQERWLARLGGQG